MTCLAWLGALEAGCTEPIQPIIDQSCVNDFEIIQVSRQEVSLSVAHDLQVRLVVGTPQDVEIIRFASNFGLTLCYERGRAFLPNATPDFF
jgi:hypothetical protein